MCNVVRYIFVGVFVAICSVASCIELSSSPETTSFKERDLSKSDSGDEDTAVGKRQILPLPRAGRSVWRPIRTEGLLPLPRAGRTSAQGMLPMPRTGRSNGLLPIMRTGRSDGILPMLRTGRSADQGLVPMPRTGRSEGMLPFPRAGRSEGMLPSPRAGRSEGMLPFPRAGRSEGMLPFPRAGRSDGMLPFPRAGRSEGMLPFPRAGRSDGQGLLPMPRAGRSDPGMLPMPRAGRSQGPSFSGRSISPEDFQFLRDQRTNDGLVPMPRAGRSLPNSYNCQDSDECPEMHDSYSFENNPSESDTDSITTQKLDRSKRSLNETLNKNETSPFIPVSSNNSSTPVMNGNETNEFALNSMIFVLEPRTPKSDDVAATADGFGRGLERHWIEFEKAFSFRYPIPSRPLLSMPLGSPSSNFFSNSLEDEIGPNSVVDPIDLQLRAVYIPRIGKRGFGDWFKRTGTSGSGPAFQPRIGRSSFFQPRTGRSMAGGAEDDVVSVDDIIYGVRPERSSFTPRIGRSVKGPSQLPIEEKTNQAGS